MERKYLLITGASSGIGEYIALNLSHDYDLIINGRNEERLNQVATKCKEKGTNTILIWKYDLTDVGNLENSLRDLISKNGIEISHFVHCAGLMKIIPLKMITSQLFMDSFKTNVISAAVITKILIGKKTNNKALKSVVLISSNISNFGAKAFAAYGSSKAALDGLMRSLAIELAPTVRVNSVLPGGVHTPMTEHLYEDEELISRMGQTYPLGLGEKSDICNAVEFLLSEKARWITGQQLTVDGGRTVNITG